MLWDVGEELGGGLPVDIYVDFDGTIAPGEPTDRLFDRFADASWRSIDRAWLEGRSRLNHDEMRNLTANLLAFLSLVTKVST